MQEFSPLINWNLPLGSTFYSNSLSLLKSWFQSWLTCCLSFKFLPYPKSPELNIQAAFNSHYLATDQFSTTHQLTWSIINVAAHHLHQASLSPLASSYSLLWEPFGELGLTRACFLEEFSPLKWKKKKIKFWICSWNCWGYKRWVLVSLGTMVYGATNPSICCPDLPLYSRDGRRARALSSVAPAPSLAS